MNATTVSLDEYRHKKRIRTALKAINRRFRIRLDHNTKVKEIPDEVLLFLIEPGPDGLHHIYNIVMALEDMDFYGGFHKLSQFAKMRVIDLAIFFLDQLRFECMRRLGWLAPNPVADEPLVDLILKREQLIPTLPPPRWNKNHPGYEEYKSLTSLDREVYIRKKIPEAINLFKEKSRGPDTK